MTDLDELQTRIEAMRRNSSTLRNSDPVEWARQAVQFANLLVENAHFQQRSENLEEAIAVCRQALAIIARELEPELWGQCQSLLAIALSDRMTGSLDDNLDEAIEVCHRALQVFSRDVTPENWASLMNILGATYLRRTRGGPSPNQENALAAFDAALQVTTRAASPQDWAYLQSNLAVLYRERIAGEPVDNLERAIAAGANALEILDPDDDFTEWAMTANSLASAWRFRVTGSPGDNLATAIHIYESIAERLDPQKEPELWADTWHNLAAAWWDQSRGDRSLNLERAIAAGSKSVEARPRETAPVAWARTALILAAAFAERVDSDRTENVERAIELSHRALEILTFETTPLDWAGGMMNLAALYVQRQRARRDVNIEAAILACDQALIVFRREVLPVDWAKTLSTLGISYYYRPRGERIDNLQKSMECFAQALEVIDRDRSPLFHAQLLQSLATATVDLAQQRGSHPSHVKEALSLYSAALEVRTRDAAPYEWSRLRHNQGNAWSLLAHGPRSRGYRKAAAAYMDALTVRTADTYPDEHRISQRRLGHLHFSARRWRAAATAYGAALSGLEKVYDFVFTPDSRQSAVAGMSDVAACAAYTQVRRKRPGTAAEILERSRTRTFADSVAREATRLRIVSIEDRAYWSDAVSRVQAKEAAVRSADPTDPRPFLQAAEELQEAQDTLSRLAENLGLQGPEVQSLPLDLAEIRRVAAAASRPLVYLATTRHGTIALPVLPDASSSEPSPFLWLDRFSSSDLDLLLEGKGSYVDASLSADTEQLGKALGRVWPLWREALTKPLDQWLGEHGFQEALLIPCGALGLFPLHAVSEGTIWTIIPSARALQGILTRLRERRARPSSLLGVGNPLPSHTPLPCGEIEIDIAGTFFRPEDRYLLRGSEATREAVVGMVNDATHLHFACHGQFYPWIPLESGLELAAGEALTLCDILDGSLDHSQVRLAVLSACETGFIEYQRAPDEVLSLPAAFLQAGVTGVISSLWSVGDLATTVFVRELYRAHIAEGLEPAPALRQAQVRLREGTAASLGVAALCEEWLERSGGRNRNAYRALRHHRAHPDAVPFFHPLHWAGFVLNGM